MTLHATHPEPHRHGCPECAQEIHDAWCPDPGCTLRATWPLEGRGIESHPDPSAIEYRKVPTVLAAPSTMSGVVETPEGRMTFDVGDYLVTDIPPTHLWPVKREVFERTYLAVEPSGNSGELDPDPLTVELGPVDGPRTACPDCGLSLPGTGRITHVADGLHWWRPEDRPAPSRRWPGIAAALCALGIIVLVALAVISGHGR